MPRMLRLTAERKGGGMGIIIAILTVTGDSSLLLRRMGAVLIHQMGRTADEQTARTPPDVRRDTASTVHVWRCRQRRPGAAVAVERSVKAAAISSATAVLRSAAAAKRGLDQATGASAAPVRGTA